MKFIYFILLSLISISICAKFKCEKEDSCEVCQRTAYRLKFKRQARCGALPRCKNTCYKVLKQWTQPGTQFEAFNKDAVGKCDVCFRGGFCSASQCEEQKRNEEKIIEGVISNTKFENIVNNSHIENMVHKILDNKKVEFRKLAKKVKKETKKALRHKKFQKKKNELSKKLQQVVDYDNQHK